MPDNSPDKTALSGLILAGGRATRMGGIDKGLVAFDGNCLIEHAIARLRPQVARIVISANRNIERYARYGWPVLEDTFGHFAGPLAGLLRALEQADEMPVLVVPCDAPLFPTQLAARLLAAYVKGATSAVIPHDGSRLQTLFGLYSPAVLSSLTDYLAAGQRKVEIWVTTLSPVIVDFSSEHEAFMNINTETDLHTAQSLLERQRINP